MYFEAGGERGGKVKEPHTRTAKSLRQKEKKSLHRNYHHHEMILRQQQHNTGRDLNRLFILFYYVDGYRAT